MKFRIGILSILLMISLLIDQSLFSLAMILAIILHECGHILAARLCGIKLRECRIGLFSAGLFPKDSIFSYKKEIFLCFAGPAVNFITSLPLIFFIHENTAFLQYFVFSSIALGILNLIPIADFDGGRILRAFLYILVEERYARGFLYLLSMVCVLLLWLLSVYILLRRGSSLSLFIFSISLFGRIFVSEQ